jgi:hypothetical protein
VVHRTRHRIRGSVALLTVALLLMACGSAQAASRTRVLGASFFALGLGLKLGGTIVSSGAAETYDAYLLTADQAELIALRDDYDSERRLGQGLSGAGNGLLAAGVLFATLSLLRGGPDAGEQVAQAPPITLTHSVARRELGVLWRHGF